MTAKAFAMACNCVSKKLASSIRNDALTEGQNGLSRGKRKSEESGCECKSCKKIRSHNHPDILMVNPSGAMIKIHQIRDLFRTLALKPYEARVRVVIISESQTMNPAAANALLKILEEPPDQTVLILTAGRTSDLLPTVVSRCRHIRFNPISEQHIQQLLMDNCGIDAAHAEALSSMANGSYSKALAMSRSNWVYHRKWLITASGLEDMENLPKRRSSLLLAFSEKLAKNKDSVLDSLGVMKMWLRDLVMWHYRPDKVMNKDLVNQIKTAAEKNSVDCLLKKIEIVDQAIKDIQSNMNLRLCLDVMMLRLAQ